MKIKIGNKDASKYIGNPSWSTSDDTNGQEMTFESLELYDIGSQVKVSDDGKVRFLGTIISMEERATPPHSYRALDFSFNMKSDEIIQFKKMEADKAIKKLLSNSGIKCKVCNMPTKITKIYKGTIIEILKDILHQAKKDQGKAYFYEVDGATVVVEEKKKIKITPTFVVSDDSSISRSIENMKNEVKVAKDNEVLATATDAGSITKFGTLRVVEDADEGTTKAKAQSIAAKELKNLNVSTSSKSLTLLVTEGYWDIRKNRLIKLSGGGLSGWYRIKSSTHSIDGNIHKVDIEVSWDAKL